MRRTSALLVLAGALTGGCGLFNQLDVKSLAVSADKPGNVAVYLAVAKGATPMNELTEKDFKIYENGQLIDPAQSGETLLDRDAVAVYHTLLLVDMSNTAHRDALARAAADFVTSARRTQGVTVYAFDGGGEIRSAGEFPRVKVGDEGPALDVVGKLASFSSHDPSRDLNGAIVAALDQLDARLMQVKKPVRVGTLVVFTEGPDLAGRVSADKLDEVLDKTEDQVLAVGIGEDKGDFRLKSVGRAGVMTAPTANDLGPTFADAGMRVSTDHDKYYLLAYCSPARAGTRALRIDVETTDKDGNNVKGSVDGEFDATGFGPGCDPKTTPRFVVKSGASAEHADRDKPAKRAGKKPPAEEPGNTDRAAKPEQTAPPEGGIVPPPSKPGYAPTPP